VSKIIVAFLALLLALVIYGSIALRHAFVEMRTQHNTTNSIIDQASR
jgi:hypothetical protein